MYKKNLKDALTKLTKAHLRSVELIYLGFGKSAEDVALLGGMIENHQSILKAISLQEQASYSSLEDYEKRESKKIKGGKDATTR